VQQQQQGGAKLKNDSENCSASFFLDEAARHNIFLASPSASNLSLCDLFRISTLCLQPDSLLPLRHRRRHIQAAAATRLLLFSFMSALVIDSMHLLHHSFLTLLRENKGGGNSVH
jgi:hypothetical protein